MIGLTSRQREIFNFIRVYLDEKAFAPSVGEIANCFGISAPAALMHLRALQKKGMIKRSSRARSIVVIRTLQTPLPNGKRMRIPLYSTADDIGRETSEQAFVPPELVNSETFQHLFACRAVHALPLSGILEGDILFVRRGVNPSSGELGLQTDPAGIFEIRQSSTSEEDERWIGKIIGIQRFF